MAKSSKEGIHNKVAKKLRGDIERIVKESKTEVSVEVKGKNVFGSRPIKETFPKKEPEGDGKLVMIQTHYFGTGKTIVASSNAWYYRLEPDEYARYGYAGAYGGNLVFF